METLEQEPVQVRWIIRRDIDRVMEIERASYDDPWTELEVCSYLRGRTNIGVVALLGGDIVGFMLYEMQTGSFRIDSIAVDPELRRNGIGYTLVARLLGKVNSQRPKVESMVREANLPALRFFRSLGFVATQLVHRPYNGSTEDGFKLEYQRGPSRLRLRNRITNNLVD